MISYDAQLYWEILPTRLCHFDCTYCFKNPAGQRLNPSAQSPSKESGFHRPNLANKILKASQMGFPALLHRLKLTLWKNKITEINIPAFIKMLEQTKKIFKITFTGGEPFLVPNLVEACEKITQKHFISFNTNLVTGKVRQLAEKIHPERILNIIASLHIKELERRKLLDQYVDNFLLFQDKGYFIRAKAVAYPKLFPEVERYKHFFADRGISMIFAAFKGQHGGKNYPEAYTKEELNAFGLDDSYRDLYNTKGRTCNAGYNIGVVQPTGVIHPCYNLYKEVGYLYGRINFQKEMTTCPVEVCACPVFQYDKHLWNKALKEKQLA